MLPKSSSQSQIPNDVAVYLLNFDWIILKWSHCHIIWDSNLEWRFGKHSTTQNEKCYASQIFIPKSNKKWYGSNVAMYLMNSEGCTATSFEIWIWDENLKSIALLKITKCYTCFPNLHPKFKSQMMWRWNHFKLMQSKFRKYTATSLSHNLGFDFRMKIWEVYSKWKMLYFPNLHLKWCGSDVTMYLLNFDWVILKWSHYYIIAASFEIWI